VAELGRNTGIGDVVRVLQVEPLEEPVPKPKRRPLTVPRVEPPPEQESARSDVEVGR
jgi:hypothetical protein